MHRWLRPGGTLVNLQPVANPLAIEIFRAGRRVETGRSWENDEKREDMRASLRALDSAVAAGLFAPRGSATWRLVMRYDRAEDWQEFLDRPVAGPVQADGAAIRAALDDPAGYVTTTEDDVGTAYRRR